MPHPQLSDISAAETARLVKSRAVSPVEVVDAAIARIEARNPSLNAFIHLGFRRRPEGRKKAAEADVMAGRPLPPLHGVPSAIKDLFDFKPGWPTTFGGVCALKNNIAQFHCPFAERIEKGGAILLGKTNAPVMGCAALATTRCSARPATPST